jgi:RimJ/RimL family protein N-acetyltransferase
MTASQSVTMEGARVKMTPLQLENIYTHFEWNNDRELNRLDSEVPYVEETFFEFKQRFDDLVFSPSPLSRDFEIHAEDGTLIGVAYVASISRHHRHCLVGVTIGDRRYWGRGYGRESLEMLLGFCFDELGMHRVAAETFEYNTAWRKVVEDAGFSREGTVREYLLRDGRYWDKEIYSILEPEYRQQRALHEATAAPDDRRGAATPATVDREM